MHSLLGATSIDKIGEVWLSDEIGEGGFEILKKLNFIITIREAFRKNKLVYDNMSKGG